MALRLLCILIIPLFVAAGVWAVPPLTDDQQVQLDTAVDEVGSLDEGALYPLLDNVMQWEPGDRRGASIPDYQAIRDNPAAARGELFLIEGQFISATPRYRLMRRGEWGDALTGWGVVVSPEPPAVLVYFVDPAGQMTSDAPRYGAEVEVVGRFYKIWTTEDAEGRTWPYLVFIARSAEVVRGGAGTVNLSAGSVVFGMILLLAALVFMLWRVRGMARRVARPRITRGPLTHDDAMTDDEPDAPLPDDPEAALAELARRHESPDERH